ncbi:MAG: hypothetical protein K0S30_2241 [Clostridia bacterium]|nr:hypothetical protein [Clostridia bacterium]
MEHQETDDIPYNEIIIRGNEMKHPFAEEVVESKYIYMMGIVMVIFENGKIGVRQKAYLTHLAEEIGLTSQDLKKILEFMKKYQKVREKVVGVLNTPYKKHYFLMEIYNMLYETSEEHNKIAAKGIGQIAQLLEITQQELNLIQKAYGDLNDKHEAYLEDIGKSYKREQFFLEEKTEDIFSTDNSVVLKEERILKKGEELVITEAYKIEAGIKVQEGATLVFDGARVELLAPIRVEGGRLEIRNSYFKAHKKMTHVMFIIMNTVVHIENTSFDGNKVTGIWCQANGELFVEKTYFKHTAYKPCVMLWECEAHIKTSHFLDCKAEKNSGGAIYTNSNLEIAESSFEACSAYKGAAIYRFASVIPWVKGTENKEVKIKKRHTSKSQMLKLFGKRVDFIPIPKSFNRIAYPLILRSNQFVDCKAQKMGIVCAYHSQVVINDNNSFEHCEGQSIYYYE